MVTFGSFVVCSAIILSAYNNSPTDTVNRTQKTAATDAQSCGQCHAKNSNVVATFSGPSQLHAGDYATYRITVTKTGEVLTPSIGIDVAASDTVATLAATAGEPTTTVQAAGVPEVTHVSGNIANLRHLNTATNYYTFRYTMPASAVDNSPHTLYGVAAVGPSTSGGWNYAPNKTVTTKAMPTAPSSVSATSSSAGKVSLSWSAAGPQYRVLVKTGTYSTGPSDGTIVYEGTGTSTTATGLSGSTTYYFSVYSKDVGVESGTLFFPARQRRPRRQPRPVLR